MQRMTRYERLNTVLAILALLLALASPFVSYYWFDPYFQSFRHRPKFQLSAQSVTFVYEYDLSGNLRRVGETGTGSNITLVNNGDAAAKEPLITILYKNERDVSMPIELSPPFPAEVTVNGNTKFIVLKRPLGPKETLGITFPEVSATLWASNEFGESATLQLAFPEVQVPDTKKRVRQP